VEVAKTLTKLKLDIICFTGSTETGRLVAIEAAKNLTPCILELGGKCPVIVDETADLHSAAIRIIFGKYINSGQTCVAADHIYIHDKIYSQFKKVLLEEIKKAFDKQDNVNSGDYGKINNLNHLKKLERLLQDQHGGTVLYGGNFVADKLHLSPTIVEKPKGDSLMMKEEIFGPIMPIHQYSSLKTLVEELRRRPKPLIVYLFSESSKNIDYVRSNTYSGSFVVNDVIIHMLNNHLPFGGVGDSGYGRYHGESGFLGFSNPKSICLTKAFNVYPLSARFFPYDDHKKRVLTFLFKVGGVNYTQLKKGSVVLAAIIAAAAGYIKLRPLL
jgi:aldehyde dehydrogenase (NAD+)